MTSLNRLDAITLFVEDLDRTKRFYEDAFALELIFEDQESAAYRLENSVLNLLTVAGARELIAPGPVAGREAGSRLQLTIWVEDTDAVCAELESRGVVLLNGPIDRAWGMRTASFADPAGNVWEIAQKI